jgi:hypothetical protein
MLKQSSKRPKITRENDKIPQDLRAIMRGISPYGRAMSMVFLGSKDRALLRRAYAIADAGPGHPTSDHDDLLMEMTKVQTEAEERTGKPLSRAKLAEAALRKFGLIVRPAVKPESRRSLQPAAVSNEDAIVSLGGSEQTLKSATRKLGDKFKKEEPDLRKRSHDIRYYYKLGLEMKLRFKNENVSKVSTLSKEQAQKLRAVKPVALRWECLAAVRAGLAKNLDAT